MALGKCKMGGIMFVVCEMKWDKNKIELKFVGYHG